MEEELAQTKQTYSTALTKLIKKVKKLEQTIKLAQARRRFRIVVSDDEEGLEDPSKQGRKITEIDQDPSISLVVLQEEEPTELVEDQGSREKGEKEVSTIGAEHSTVIPKPEKKTKKQLEQERLRHEEAVRLQEQLNEEETQRIARDAKIARQLHEEINKTRQERNRLYFVADVRKNMIMYLKNQGGYKMSYFKGMKYEEIRPIFEKVWVQNQSFILMDSEDKEKGSKKKAGGSRKKTLAKKRAGEKQSDQSVKRRKVEYEKEKEELKAYLDIVPGEEFAMDFESLVTKFPIVDWKTHVLTKNFMYYQIFRADGSSKNYKIFSEMLDDFDRQDVMDLHNLVEERFATSRPEGYDLMLWGDLKTLFEPDKEDEV
ncbi:hypothetical protein Tco_0110645 [Tanacetum coccineum]